MTGRELYGMALDLSGIRLPNGEIPDTAKDLEARCISLINILITENAHMSSILTKELPTPSLICDLDEAIILDSRICNLCLPYALASLLVMPDDRQQGTFLQNSYLLAVKQLKSESPALSHPIKEVY